VLSKLGVASGDGPLKKYHRAGVAAERDSGQGNNQAACKNMGKCRIACSGMLVVGQLGLTESEGCSNREGYELTCQV